MPAGHWHAAGIGRAGGSDPPGVHRSREGVPPWPAALADDDGAPYLLSSGRNPVGLAFVRGLGGPIRVLNSFFVMRGARRAGIGRRAAGQVLALHPGAWEVAFQDADAPAVRFWRRVATEIAGAAWTEERRPVPGDRAAPADVWISFEAAA